MELTERQVRDKLYYLKKTGQIEKYDQLKNIKDNNIILTKKQIRDKLHYLKKTNQLEEYNKMFTKYRSMENIQIKTQNKSFENEYSNQIQKNKYLKSLIRKN